MDKKLPRWKNVPTPNRGAQLTLLGTCLEMLANGDLCGDIDSIVFSSNSTLASSIDTPVKEATASDRRKFAARAPPRLAVLPKENENEDKRSMSLVNEDLQFRPPNVEVAENAPPNVGVNVERCVILKFLSSSMFILLLLKTPERKQRATKRISRSRRSWWKSDCSNRGRRNHLRRSWTIHEGEGEKEGPGLSGKNNEGYRGGKGV